MLIQFDKFDELTMGDQDFAQELLQAYIGQFEEYAREIKLGVEQSDLKKILFFNHKVKSTVIMLKMDKIRTQQLALEEAMKKNQQHSLHEIFEPLYNNCQQAVEKMRDYMKKIS